MSLNSVPLKVVLEKDPMVDVSQLDKRAYACIDAGQTVTYQRYICSNVSNSSLQILTIPPSDKTIIDTRVYAKVKYLLTFAGTSSSGNLLQLGSADAPRAFPFNNSCSVSTMTLNGQSVSVNVGSYIDALLRYGKNYDDQDLCYAGTPHQFDQCTQYSQLFGTARSTMAPYGANVLNDSNAAFPGVTILTNTPTAATVQLDIYEPIMIPLLWENKHGLVNVLNLSFLFTLKQNLVNYLWSHDATNGNNISSSVAVVQDFSLIFRFITPKVLSSVPQNAIYPYYAIIPNSQQLSSIASGATTQVAMNSINLQSIPKMVYIFVKEIDSEQSINIPNSYFNISNVNVTYMNTTGRLASCEPQGLYQIAHDNGFNGSYAQWAKNNGSVLCLRFGKDIPLDSLYSPGQLVVNQISMTMAITNLSNRTITPMCYWMFVHEGVGVISNGSLSLSTNVLSNSDVLNAQIENAPSIEMTRPHSIYGGSINDVVNKLGKWVDSTSDLVEEVGPYVKKALPLIGLGGSMVGGRRRKTKGGELISARELKQQSDKYSEY